MHVWLIESWLLNIHDFEHSKLSKDFPNGSAIYDYDIISVGFDFFLFGGNGYERKMLRYLKR